MCEKSIPCMLSFLERVKTEEVGFPSSTKVSNCSGKKKFENVLFFLSDSSRFEGYKKWSLISPPENEFEPPIFLRNFLFPLENNENETNIYQSLGHNFILYLSIFLKWKQFEFYFPLVICEVKRWITKMEDMDQYDIMKNLKISTFDGVFHYVLRYSHHHLSTCEKRLKKSDDKDHI